MQSSTYDHKWDQNFSCKARRLLKEVTRDFATFFFLPWPLSKLHQLLSETGQSLSESSFPQTPCLSEAGWESRKW